MGGGGGGWGGGELQQQARLQARTKEKQNRQPDGEELRVERRQSVGAPV